MHFTQNLKKNNNSNEKFISWKKQCEVWYRDWLQESTWASAICSNDWFLSILPTILIYSGCLTYSDKARILIYSANNSDLFWTFNIQWQSQGWYQKSKWASRTSPLDEFWYILSIANENKANNLVILPKNYCQERFCIILGLYHNKKILVDAEGIQHITRLCTALLSYVLMYAELS